MDLTFSDEQTVLRDGARDFLARECPMARVRQWMEEPLGFDEGFWKQLAELGWPGLALPEALGGAGLGWLELALVLEETGRVLAPGPFRSAVVGAAAVALGAAPARRSEVVPALARGERRATVAHLEPDGRGRAPAARPALAAVRHGDGFQLAGTKLFVEDAHCADWLVVTAHLDGATAGFLVPTDARGLSIRPNAWVDPTRRTCEVRLADVRVPAADRLAGEDGAGWLERVGDLARTAACAELCGVASRALELAVAFAGQREQFGRPVGSFQAIQHRCADMLVAVEASRSVTWDAAWSLAHDAPDAHTAACMAKAWCSQTVPRVAADAIQIHGGLGFTWEQDPQLYYKRAVSLAALWGDASACREEVARAVVDDAAPRLNGGSSSRRR